MSKPLRGKLILMGVVSVLLHGCETQDPNSEIRSCSSIIEGWANQGVNLPSESDVDFFRAGLPESIEPLRCSISSESEDIRMSSAYLAEKLGNAAVALGPNLIVQLSEENSAIVRVYLSSAIASVGFKDENMISDLRNLFEGEEDIQVKTNIAGALVRLNSAEHEADAWDWLLTSISPSRGIKFESQVIENKFWEQRWAAIKHLRHMEYKINVIRPLLIELKRDSNTPQWVIDQQINPALGSDLLPEN